MELKELEILVDKFGYKNLMERYKTIEKLGNIKEGDVVIDGGAFQGDMLIYFSKKVGKTGKVISFEPDHLNYQACLSLILKEQLNNVTIIQMALWNEDKKIPFYFSNYNNASSPVKEFYKVSDSSVLVRACKLDTVLNKLHIDKVNFIWTNIEASESIALQGMKNTIINNNPRILISTHKIHDNIYTTDDVIEFLNSIGYITKRVDNHSGWIFAYKE
jgi:FkbM family methyltransferase